MPRAFGVLEEGDHELAEFDTSIGELGPTEVLVKPLYVAVNPVDGKRLQGLLPLPGYPFTLGGDAYGEVIEAGAQSGLQKGDHVSLYGGPPTCGSYTDVIKLPIWRCVPNPPFDAQEAAVLGPGYCTPFSGLCAVMKILELRNGDELHPTLPIDTPILIWGGSSQVGGFGIQLLALAGYKRVITTASAKHHDYVRSLGAAEVLDYSIRDVVAAIKKAAGVESFKAVFDGVSTPESLAAINELVDSDSVVGLVVPVKIPSLERTDVKAKPVFSMSYFQPGTGNEYLRDNFLPKLTPALLKRGLKGSRVRLLEGGSLKDRLMRGIEEHRSGTVSNEKLVVKWSD